METLCYTFIYIKKIYLLIFTLLAPFSLFGLEKAHAADHKLDSLHIHVFIYSDESARITEKRSAYLTEGTENYLVFGNLGKSEIETFTVWENGSTFQYVDNWDIKASQREKYFKNGIVEKKDGYELNWGIGEYGKHNYIVEYTITNFIKQLHDSQILFWRLVNDQTNIPPEEVTVEIESEQTFSADEENIWAFGFPGTVNFHEGKVIATNSQPLTKDDYVTILVELPDGMFAAEDIIDKPFEAIKEEAFEGSDYGKEASGSGVSIFKYIKNTFIFLFIIFILYAKFKKSAPKLTKKRPKRFKRKYPGEYYRDYPYHGDFLDIYYLSYIIGASNSKNC